MKKLFGSKLAFIGILIVLIASFGAVAVFSFAASGQAELFKDNLIITTNDVSFTYNGEERVVDDNELHLESGDLAPGDYFAIDPEEKVVFEAKTTRNRVNYKILNFSGEDVTSDYNITNNWGDITVKKRSITIDLASSVDPTTITNGQTLTDEFLQIGDDGLARSDSLTATVRKHESEGGYFSFSFNFKVYNNVYKKDVTSSYVLKSELNFATRPDIDIPPFEDWPEDVEIPDINQDFGFDTTFGDMFQNFPNDLDLKTPVFQMNSDVEGTYYFRGLSLGDYNGVGFDEAPSYESGTVSPLEYSTRNIKDEYPKATVSVKLANNLNFSVCDFVPNFTESSKKLANDICYNLDKNDENAYQVNSYVVSDLNLDELSNYQISNPTIYNEEIKYSEYVKNTYLSVSSYLKMQLNDWLNANGIYLNTLQSFTDDLKNFFLNNFKYDIKGYADESVDNVYTFLTDVRSGNCMNFAASATMLFRSVGIPARIVMGFMVNHNEANVQTNVTIMNAHAWTEIYVDNFGWAPLEFTPSNPYLPDLDEENHYEYVENDPNATTEGSGVTGDINFVSPQYNNLFDVQVSEPGSYYLRKENYGDFQGNKFNDATVYNVSENPNPNYFVGEQLKDSGRNKRTINIYYNENVPRDKDLVSSYYFGEGDPVANNDIYFTPQEVDGTLALTSSMSDIDYDFASNVDSIDSLSFLNPSYTEAESLYYHFAKVYYTNMPEGLSKEIDKKISQVTPVVPQDPKIVIPLVIEYLSEANVIYDPLYEPDYNHDSPQQTIEDILNRNEVRCDSSIIAGAAAVLLRYFEIPTRLVNGYLYEANSNERRSITEVNEYYWNEIYIKGHGWVRLDLAKACNFVDDVYYQGKTKITVKTDSISKEYDGTSISSEPKIEIEGEVPSSHVISYLPKASITDAGQTVADAFLFITTGDGSDVSYQYSIDYDYGYLEILRRTITVYTKTVDTTYEDGKVLVPEIYNIQSGELDMSKFEIKFRPIKTLDSVGSCEAEIEIYAIYDQYGKNVKDNFQINYVFGQLTMY